jgi:hypothetical protein
MASLTHEKNSLLLAQGEVLNVNNGAATETDDYQTLTNSNSMQSDAPTLDETRESLAEKRMTAEEYESLSAEEKDDLCGSKITIPTDHSQKTPSLLDGMSYADEYDNAQRKDYFFTPECSEEKVAELQEERQAAVPDKQVEEKPVEDSRTDEQRLRANMAKVETLSVTYMEDIYGKFRGTDKEAEPTAMYKSLQEATDPELIELRGLLYGETDGGQDSDSGLYDLIRNGKVANEEVLARIEENITGDSTEEKLGKVEEALERLAVYEQDFGNEAKAEQESEPKAKEVSDVTEVKEGETEKSEVKSTVEEGFSDKQLASDSFLTKGAEATLNDYTILQGNALELTYDLNGVENLSERIRVEILENTVPEDGAASAKPLIEGSTDSSAGQKLQVLPESNNLAPGSYKLRLSDSGSQKRLVEIPFVINEKEGQGNMT